MGAGGTLEERLSFESNFRLNSSTRDGGAADSDGCFSDDVALEGDAGAVMTFFTNSLSSTGLGPPYPPETETFLDRVGDGGAATGAADGAGVLGAGATLSCGEDSVEALISAARRDEGVVRMASARLAISLIRVAGGPVGP